MIDAVLVYPRLGSFANVIVDLPLSILYAASHAVKAGHEVRLLDLRVVEGDWREALRPHLDAGVRLLGISVMTGLPLKNARDISCFVRQHYPGVKICWGGPHCTVLPETIEEPYVDYLVRGYGSQALERLLSALKGGGSDLGEIAGLSYKRQGQAVHIDRSSEHEMISYRDLPYDLLDVDSPSYQRVYMRQKMFPVFTAIGCPYQCSFCVHPTMYRVIAGKKWMPFPEDEIIGHLKMLIERYGATHISIIDDTSFPDLKRMRSLFERIIAEEIKLTLEFRGARINEIDRMDDEFLELMVKAGGHLLMVGVESCSDRVLKHMQKGISKEQILRANRKLARHPGLTAHYNLIYGTPGETYEDLVETKDVVLQMIADNPQAYFGFGGDWKPIPGSRMLDAARQYPGFQEPRSIDDWIAMDSSDADHKIVHPWYTRRHNNLIKLMQVGSFFIDDKIIKETSANQTPLFKTIRALARIYKPVALARLKHNLHQGLLEYWLWRQSVKLLPRLL